MRASPLLARALLCAGLLWLATRRSHEAGGAAMVPGSSGPRDLLNGALALPSLAAAHRRAVASRTARGAAAAASWDPGYLQAADLGKLSPVDFVKRHLEGAVDEAVVEAQLASLKVRASSGFRFAYEALTGENFEKAVIALKAAPAYAFKAKDDPMILVHDEQGKVIETHHYVGPAVMLFFDKGGALQHIDFVGVCDSCGGNRQSPTADYVGEHARLYVQTGQWKYRDECGRHTAEVSACDWVSEKPAGWEPELKWLQPFMSGKTFVLHAFQPRIIEGPQFGTIWSMAVAPELNQLDFERAQANEWVNAMLFVVGSAQQFSGLKQDAEELLCYAIMYGMAMANTGPQLAAAVAGR